jgi:hypothetical protein
MFEFEGLDILEAQYSFSHAQLKSEFLSVGQKINLDFVMGGKQHDLILFREFCIGKYVVPPRQVFSYDATSTSGPTEMNAFRTLLDWETHAATEKLEVIIKSTYTSCTWIVDYFVISTFPAMFGQFASEEYLLAGAKFLVTYMRDDLIPQLVGCYLLHCFLFRDRFAEAFFQRVAAGNSTERDALLLSLVESFEACVSYFSPQHMLVVNLLRKLDARLAISAVVRHFLVPCVYLWTFAPYWSSTDVVAVRRSSKSRTQFDFVLQNAVSEMVTNSALCTRLLDAFQSSACTEMPRIGQIIFQKGVRFALTRVDTFLMQNVVAANRAQEKSLPFAPTLADSSTVLQDAFIIRRNFIHFPQSGQFKLPDPPVAFVTGEMTPDVLKFNKTYHNALFSLAGGLKQFHTRIEAIQNILRCACRLYVYRILPSQQRGQARSLMHPVYFAQEQRVEYALCVFRTFIRRQILPFIEKRIQPGKCDEVFREELGNRIQNLLNDPSASITHCIMQATVDYANVWRAEYNKAQRQEIGPYSANRDTEYPQCEYVVNSINLIVLAQLLLRLSQQEFPFRIPIPPPKQASPGDRFEVLQRIVSEAEGSYSANFTPGLWRRARDTRKKNRSVIDQSIVDIKFLVQTAERTFKEQFEKGEEKLDVGERILLFLGIERWLTPVFNVDHGQDRQRAIIGQLCDEQEAWFFRAFLIQALDVIELCAEGNLDGLSDLNRIRNPVTPDIVLSIKRLAHNFAVGDFPESQELQ